MYSNTHKEIKREYKSEHSFALLLFLFFTLWLGFRLDFKFGLGLMLELKLWLEFALGLGFGLGLE